MLTDLCVVSVPGLDRGLEGELSLDVSSSSGGSTMRIMALAVA